jgi:hypothetical protein
MGGKSTAVVTFPHPPRSNAGAVVNDVLLVVVNPRLIDLWDTGSRPGTCGLVPKIRHLSNGIGGECGIPATPKPDVIVYLDHGWHGRGDFAR